MGVADASEQLAAAQAECVRLEGIIREALTEFEGIGPDPYGSIARMVEKLEKYKEAK